MFACSKCSTVSQTSPPMCGAVQLDNVCGASLLVQAVHVLGDQRIHPAPLLQPRQALVRSIWVDVTELMPSCIQVLH